MPDWILPWIVAGLAIWPLLQVKRWIHRHIQGLGLLLTNNPQAAVLIYYLTLLPGVTLHEASQWVLAKLLGVRVKKFRLWPEKRRKVISLGLVEIDKNTDDFRATLVGMIPLATGVAAIALIGGARFHPEGVISALNTGDLPTIFAALRDFTAVPDFWLWIYLVFAIANAMMPEEHDRINWWILLGIAVGVSAILLLLDLSILLKVWVEGPLTQMARWLSFAFVVALGIDLFMMAVIATAEAVFSRLLKRELEYR